MTENFQYAWALLWSGRTLAIVLGVLFALIALSLLIASRTRWGRAKPITKCIVISVLAHVWLLLYACGTRVVLPQGDPNGAMDSVAVSLDATRLEPAGPLASIQSDATADNEEEILPEPRALPAWEQPLEASALAKPDLFAGAPATATELSAADLLSSFEPAPLPELPEGKSPQEEAKFETSLLEPPPADATLQAALTQEFMPLPPGPQSALSIADASLPSLPREHVPTLPVVNSQPRHINGASLPVEYQLRQSSDRLELARPFGADQDTEAAVAAALTWLARTQGSDGGWNAKQFGAGTETFALGENRRGTGDRADTGVSGLALLAFLSAGHTHLDGEHRHAVQRGLEYLIRAQMPSGDLSGPQQTGSDASVTNARMYCHGIATLAMAEAYALTHDAAVREPLLRAVKYTLAAQDPRGGGWRYRPGDAGDLSQFGWQAMALRSAERSGLRIEPIVKQRMAQFLDSCATGPSGGLARYRPFEGPPSPTMTAEALACRLLLKMRRPAAAQYEARAMLLNNLPGDGEDNVYYWYYATLALFQLQDESWARWNVALKTRLLSTQKPAYDAEAGSWDPDRLWGGYGGRVYSTAMACMCLEVYYRYLPLYQHK